MFGWMCVASLSFYLINSQQHLVTRVNCRKKLEGFKNTTRSVEILNDFASSSLLLNYLFRSKSDITNEKALDVKERQNGDSILGNIPTIEPNRLKDICVLVCLVLIGFSMSTLVPSVQSYAAIPYSQKTYSWSLILSSLAQPFGSFASFFIHSRRTSLLVGLTSICVACVGMIVWIAAQSPMPILKHSIWGSILIVISSCSSLKVSK